MSGRSKNIVCIHLGQAGLQVGQAAWELLSAEHGINADGNLKDDEIADFTFETFFHETPDGQYVPRALLVDLEPTVMDEIRTGTYKRFFHPDLMVNGMEDAASNFARGRITLGRYVMPLLLEKIRFIAECCDNVQGFFIFNSYGGGTGTGLASYLAEKLAHEFSRRSRVNIGIFPGDHFGSACVEPYNSLFFTQSVIRDCDLSILVDNDSLHRICATNLNCVSPTFFNTNRVISQVVSSLTCNLRFDGAFRGTLDSLKTNLIPYPTMCFPITSFAPIMSEDRIIHQRLNTEELIRACFDPSSRMVDCKLEKSSYMAACMYFRGGFSPNEINAAICDIKTKRGFRWVNWCPTGFKMDINSQPPTLVPGSYIGNHARSVLLLTNTGAIVEAFQRMKSQVSAMMRKGAFMHWYEREGMEKEEFEHAFEDLSVIEIDYKEASREVTEYDESEEDEEEKEVVKMPEKSLKSKKVDRTSIEDSNINLIRHIKKGRGASSSEPTVTEREATADDVNLNIPKDRTDSYEEPKVESKSQKRETDTSDETKKEMSEDKKEPSENEKEPSENEKEPSENEKEPSENEKEPSENVKEIDEAEKAEKTSDDKELLRRSKASSVKDRKSQFVVPIEDLKDHHFIMGDSKCVCEDCILIQQKAGMRDSELSEGKLIANNLCKGCLIGLSIVDDKELCSDCRHKVDETFKNTNLYKSIMISSLCSADSERFSYKKLATDRDIAAVMNNRIILAEDLCSNCTENMGSEEEAILIYGCIPIRSLCLECEQSHKREVEIHARKAIVASDLCEACKSEVHNVQPKLCKVWGAIENDEMCSECVDNIRIDSETGMIDPGSLCDVCRYKIDAVTPTARPVKGSVTSDKVCNICKKRGRITSRDVAIDPINLCSRCKHSVKNDTAKIYFLKGSFDAESLCENCRGTALKKNKVNLDDLCVECKMVVGGKGNDYQVRGFIDGRRICDNCLDTIRSRPDGGSCATIHISSICDTCKPYMFGKKDTINVRGGIRDSDLCENCKPKIITLSHVESSQALCNECLETIPRSGGIDKRLMCGHCVKKIKPAGDSLNNNRVYDMSSKSSASSSSKKSSASRSGKKRIATSSTKKRKLIFSGTKSNVTRSSKKSVNEDNVNLQHEYGACVYCGSPSIECGDTVMKVCAECYAYCDVEKDLCWFIANLNHCQDCKFQMVMPSLKSTVLEPTIKGGPGDFCDDCFRMLGIPSQLIGLCKECRQENKENNKTVTLQWESVSNQCKQCMKELQVDMITLTELIEECSDNCFLHTFREREPDVITEVRSSFTDDNKKKDKISSSSTRTSSEKKREDADTPGAEPAFRGRSISNYLKMKLDTARYSMTFDKLLQKNRKTLLAGEAEKGFMKERFGPFNY